jgi:hypothetical protein
VIGDIFYILTVDGVESFASSSTVGGGAAEAVVGGGVIATAAIGTRSIGVRNHLAHGEAAGPRAARSSCRVAVASCMVWAGVSN